MDNYTALPIRDLTPDNKSAIEYFYKPPTKLAMFLAIYLPIILSISFGAAFFKFYQCLIFGALLAIFFVILHKWNVRRKTARAEYIYQYGEEQTITLSDISSNYGTRVNGTPQQIITLQHNGEPLKIKTFNFKIIAAFSLPQQTVYVHPKYPNVIIPSGLFLLDRTAAANRRKGRNVSV